MQPSRRAFLLAGRAPADPWGRFMQRLGRSVKGRVEDRKPGRDAPGLAYLRPGAFTDIHHALVLCAEAGVRFILDGYAPVAGLPCLLVDPGALAAIRSLPDGGVEAEAGARVGDIRTHLQGACPGAPDNWTLAYWLAASRDYPPAQLQGSGLASVQVLLADRSTEVFGPFGVSSQRALSLHISRLVSDLFTWVARPEVAAWRSLPRWPGRYRIDALLADVPNLAHVLLGSGGALAWPESIRLEAPGVAPAAADAEPDAAAAPADPTAVALLDERIRQRFDAASRFS